MLLAALLPALGLRVGFVLGADFPLNDGGLFYAMARDLHATGFALPAYTTYNGDGIPFAYPPLGVYLAAALAALGPWSLLDVFRFLPLALNLLTVGAVYLFARAWLGVTLAALLATLAFAYQPRSFLWLIMGGGVTRSLGMLLGVLTLWQAYTMYRRSQPRAVLLATLGMAGVVLSHLEMAAFTALSIVLLGLFYGRHRAGLLATATVAGGAAVLTAPWWATVAARHSAEVFLAAGSTGAEPDSALFLLLLMWVPERWFSLVAVLAVVGAVVCLATRQYFPLVWLAAAFLLTPRGVPNRATLPVALLAVAGLVALLPWLTRRPRRAVPLGDWRAWLNDAALAGALQRRGVQLALLVFVLHATVIGWVSARPTLGALDADERAALAWVRAHLPADSAVLVVPTERFWGLDRVAEWLPALGERHSVATVQGSEWLPGGEFRRRIEASEQLVGCVSQPPACLDQWASATGTEFTHVYIPKRAPAPLAAALSTDGLRAALAGDRRYALRYDGPGASIFERLPYGGPQTR